MKIKSYVAKKTMNQLGESTVKKQPQGLNQQLQQKFFEELSDLESQALNAGRSSTAGRSSMIFIGSWL